MLRRSHSVLGKSSSIIFLWRTRAACRLPRQLNPIHRVISTSLFSFGAPETTSERHTDAHGTKIADEGVETSAPSIDKWNIDPQTGKRRVGSNWNYLAELSALAHRVGIDVVHLPVLQVALRDKGLLGSMPKSRAQGLQECSRLSVLGQSAMLHYIQEHLYFNYPKLEGMMLKDISDFLTSEAALTDLASHLGISQLIQTRKVLSDPSNSYVVTNAFCAVIGVLYEKQGSKSARSFVHDFVVSQLANKDLGDLIKLQHPRFMLHAILKSKGQLRPVSRLIKESGRATHFPSFVVGVYTGDWQLGEGCGTSIKRAEKEAILAALQTHFQTELSRSPLPSDHDDFIPEEQLQLNTNESEEGNGK